MMKYLLILLTVVAVPALAQSKFMDEIPKEYGFKIELGQTVPDFNIELPDGSKTPIKELRGKVIMLQFTASWCGVCRSEMPHIEKEIWQKHKSNPNFALYGIDLGETRDKLASFSKSMGITYPFALDLKSQIFKLFTVEKAGVTRNIILDKEGKIVFVTRLFNKDEFNKMIEVIDELLNE